MVTFAIGLVEKKKMADCCFLHTFLPSKEDIKNKDLVLQKNNNK